MAGQPGALGCLGQVTLVTLVTVGGAVAASVTSVTSVNCQWAQDWARPAASAQRIYPGNVQESAKVSDRHQSYL